MPKKRTPTKRQKPRKTAPKPACWPAYAHDDVGYLWAREAIRYGNAEILARYLWQADEIDPRVRRELAEMLNPTSNHTWRLQARQRFPGKPTKQAKRWKLLFNETIVNLAKLLSGWIHLTPDALEHFQTCSIRIRVMNCSSTSSSENLAGRLLAPPRQYWAGLVVPPPIETDPTMLLARDATTYPRCEGRRT